MDVAGEPSGAAAVPPERFVGYWSAFGDDVGQLQSAQTYAWGPSYDDDAQGVTTPRPEYSHLDLAAASAGIARAAHARATTYAYKPLLTDRSIRPTAAWFQSYLHTLLLPVVTADPSTQPDLIVLETELDGAIGSAYDGQWRALIAQLRAAGYRGKLLGTSDDRYIAGWFDSVDYVGGDFYPTIDTSSLPAATASWEQQVGWQVDAYHRGSGKPVLFGELGSYQGSMSPAQWSNYLGGLFADMARHPAWSGGLFWAGWGGFSATAAQGQSTTAPPLPATVSLAAAQAQWVVDAR